MEHFIFEEVLVMICYIGQCLQSMFSPSYAMEITLLSSMLKVPEAEHLNHMLQSLVSLVILSVVFKGNIGHQDQSSVMTYWSEHDFIGLNHLN